MPAALRPQPLELIALVAVATAADEVRVLSELQAKHLANYQQDTEAAKQLLTVGEKPADAALDPRVDEQLAAYDAPLADLLPRPALYVFLRCWSRLYGTVTLEVFGHLHWALNDTEPLFEDMLADNTRALGILDDYHRP